MLCCARVFKIYICVLISRCGWTLGEKLVFFVFPSNTYGYMVRRKRWGEIRLPGKLSRKSVQRRYIFRVCLPIPNNFPGRHSDLSALSLSVKSLWGDLSAIYISVKLKTNGTPAATTPLFGGQFLNLKFSYLAWCQKYPTLPATTTTTIWQAERKSKACCGIR